ncbi:E3 ubiquitin-protein ligase TRIM39-like [Lithobates pipiens]
MASISQDGQPCTECVKTCTDPELDKRGIISAPYVCPESREQSSEQPAFIKDTTREEEAVIFCTYCIHSSVPVIQSCLHCEASLCDDHLKAHNKSPEHVLTELTTSPENRKCSIHKKILEYYCYEDNVCICVYCLAEKHRLHQLENLDEATAKKKKKLKDLLETLVSESEDLEKNCQNIIRSMMGIPKKVSDLKEKVASSFQDIRRRLEDLEKRVLEEIFNQETAMIVSGNIQLQKLNVKKTLLSSKMRRIEELCKETDPLTVLEFGEDNFYDNSEDQKKDDLKEADKKMYVVEDLNKFLIALTLHNGLNNIVTETRKEYCIPEAKEILLDLNTAANNVLVSSDLKSVSWSVLGQRRKETVERFEQHQVLNTSAFSAGRHYWEVEASESEYWMMGVTYPSIDPKSPESWIGNNGKSWCLCKWHDEYSIRHDSKDVNTHSYLSCKKVGIYLDYEAGQLSFYELSDHIRHLHTFTATFTEPLHAAFWVEDNGWLRITS